ncbi:IQ-domain 33 [Raphanus sativus]|nr:IQ-domain 33 [Raphanus sativus]
MSQQLSSDSVSVKQHLEDDEDSVSVTSSEVKVTQPLQDKISKVVKEDADNKSEATETHIPKRHLTSPISKLFLKEDAAIIIQSAFRSYLAKREVEKTFAKEECFSGGKVSMGTSLKVQTRNSVKAPFIRTKLVSPTRRTLQKNKTQVVMRIKVSKHLMICSKKKQIDRSTEDEYNNGWSWLERWMATRVPDRIPLEPRTNIQGDVQRLARKNRSFSIAWRCASNDLPLQFESISETLEEET